MTLMRNAFRSVFRRLFRTLLVSSVLALCVAVLISTIAGVKASEESTAEMVAGVEESAAEIVTRVEEDAEETIELTEKMSLSIMVGGFGGMRPGMSGGMSEDVVDDIYAIEGVAAVLPSLTQRVGGSSEPRSRDYDYAVNGVLLNASLVEEYSVLPLHIIDGRQIKEGDGAAVLLNQDLTGYFEAGVGDTITLKESEFEVVGIFYRTQFGEQKTIYISLGNAQNLFDKEGEVSFLQVFAETESDVDSVAEAIEKLDDGWFVRTMDDMGMGKFGGAIALTQEEQVASIQGQASFQIAAIQENAELQIAALQDGLGNIESLGVQISLVVGIAGILMIFGIMFYTVRERTREIGILKALGFSNPYVMKRFMLEGSYIGFLGGLIGVALGAVTCSLLEPWLLDISEATSVALEPYYLLIGLSAAENVELPMECLIKSGKQRREKARELLALVGLQEREGHRPAQLSAGEQQRVAIARSLANEPAIILADEPTGNLDSETGLSIVKMLGQLTIERKCTVVAVTHDQRMASLAGRTLSLRDGMLRQE